MFEPLILHVDPDLDGRWRVALHHPALLPVWAEIPADRASRLVEEVNAAMSPEGLPAMLPPNREAPFVAQEERAGRTLAAVLHANVAMTTALAEARLRARQASVSIALVVAASGVASELPWELLADAPDGLGLEVTGTAVIARLVYGAPVAPRAGAWSWDAEALETHDALVSRLLEHLQAVATRVGLLRSGAGSVGGPRLRVVAGHGERDLAELSLRTAAGVVAPPAALAAVSAPADLGVLAICDAGPRCATLVSEPVDLLLRGGWGAVIAPRGRVLIDGCAVLCEALMSALGGGASLLVATLEARRALRARALAMPEGRWHRWVLHLSDLRQAIDATPRVAAAPRLALGWPTLASDAEALVSRAIELSHRLRSGFLGLEHLALALIEAPPEATTFLWRSQLIRVQAQILTQLGGYTAIGEPTPRPTPRLIALGRELKPGASAGELWGALKQAPLWWHVYLVSVWPAQHDRNGSTLRTLPSLDLWGEADQRPTLEALGGPEDGRVLHPTPGDVLGRGDELALTTLRLYADTDAYDGWLSRSHLGFVGPRSVRAMRSLKLARAGGTLAMEAGAELELLPGDLLNLTTYTRVLMREGPA